MPGRAIDQAPRCLSLNRHVREHVLDSLRAIHGVLSVRYLPLEA